MVVDSKYGWGNKRKVSGVEVSSETKVVKSFKEPLQEFMKYVESKNSHGRVKTLNELERLGLAKSKLYADVKDGPTSNGKNVLKGIVLYALIERLK